MTSTDITLRGKHRIAFAGASGTGKTTLARFVAERYGVPLNPVGARSVSQAMGYESPYDVDRAGRRAEFQARLMEEKLRWEAGHSSFVTDRTPLDNVAYSRLHCPELVTASFLLKAGSWSEVGYSEIYFCPLRSFRQHGGDPARVEDADYQARFEHELVTLLIEHGRLPVAVLRATSQEERERELVRRIGGQRRRFLEYATEMPP